MGQCPLAALLWDWDKQDYSLPPPPQTALSCVGALRGARQGRVSSPSLGLCCLLLLSKGWLCPSCSSAGTLCEAGRQDLPVEHKAPLLKLKPGRH